MTSLFSRLIVAALSGSLLPWPAYALAGESGEAVAVPEATAAVMFGRRAIAAEALDAQRGGTEIQISNSSTVDGALHDNQASWLTTGNNSIADGSLSGLNGFATVVQNSGNNVLIQNSTIINLQVQ